VKEHYGGHFSFTIFPLREIAEIFGLVPSIWREISDFSNSFIAFVSPGKRLKRPLDWIILILLVGSVKR